MVNTYKKRFFSLFIVIILFSFNTYTYTYANAGAGTAGKFGLTNKLDTFNAIGNNLKSSFPSSMMNGYAVDYATNIHKIEMELMQEKWNTLSDEQKQSYNNDIWTFRFKSGEKFYKKAIDKYTAESKEKLGAEFEVFKSHFLSFMDKTFDSLSSLPSFDLNQKIRFQVDTDFLNRSLDLNKSVDTTLKNRFNILSSQSYIDSINTSDVSNMSYSDLYYSLSTEIDRANFLYEITARFPTRKTKVKPFTCIMIQPYYMDVLSSEDYRVFYSNIDVFLPRQHFIDVYGMPIFPSLEMNRYSFDKNILFIPVLGVENFSSLYVPKDNGVYQRFINSAFSHSDQYVLDTQKIVSYGNSVGGYSSNVLSYTSTSLQDDDYGSVIPKSIVSNTVQLPFSSSEDISKFREIYTLYKYKIDNRPVNYVIELGDFLKGRLDKSTPAHKNIVADLPSVNVTDFPLTDTNSLPSADDVDKQKKKENLNQKDKDINKGLGISKKELTDVINDTLTNLFVPTDTFFESQVDSIKSDLDGKIDIHYIDKIFNGFKNVGVYRFDDIYIDLDGKRVKIFDFSFVRNNLSSIKKFTDPLFWLLLMLFVFNETHFLIRGTYPLTLRRSEKSDN